MDKRKILNEIYQKQNKKDLEKINMLKSNKKINALSREISKQSINLAKMNLNGMSYPFESKDQMYKTIRENIEKYNKLNTIKYNCDICKDRIIIHGKICNCFRSVIKKNWIKSPSEDLPLNLFNFDNFDFKYYSDEGNEKFKSKELIRRAFDFCVDYSRNFDECSKSLLFIGEPGIGKTHLACAVGNRIAQNGFYVVYISFPKEVIGKSSFVGDRKTQLNSDLLIIDDLGMECPTSLTVSLLYDIINTRIIKSLKTILITNLSLKGIEKIYGKTLFSRIRSFTQIMFPGNDVRQQIKKGG